MTDAEVDAIISANIADGLLAKHPKYSATRLKELVRETRSSGFALNPGMMLTGSWAIGVAIRDASRRPVGALSIAAIEHRMTKQRQRELMPLLLAEAREVESRLLKAKAGGVPVRKKVTAKT